MKQQHRGQLNLCVGVGFVLLIIAALFAQNSPKPDLLTKWGTPEGTVVRRGAYCMAIDGRTRSARWVLERLTPANLVGHGDRTGMTFRPDPAEPPEFQATAADYAEPIFDIGHLAPAADYPAKDEMIATFNFANAVPQHAEFNRHSWLRLETHVRDLAKTADAVWVVTAPIYQPLPSSVTVTYGVIGKNRVAVPPFCGKAVLVQQAGTLTCHAWILPNQDGLKAPLDSFAVTTDDFERAAGLDVWRKLDKPTQDRLEAAK